MAHNSAGLAYTTWQGIQHHAEGGMRSEHETARLMKLTDYNDIEPYLMTFERIWLYTKWVRRDRCMTWHPSCSASHWNMAECEKLQRSLPKHAICLWTDMSHKHQANCTLMQCNSTPFVLRFAAHSIQEDSTTISWRHFVQTWLLDRQKEVSQVYRRVEPHNKLLQHIKDLFGKLMYNYINFSMSLLLTLGFNCEYCSVKTFVVRKKCSL